MLRYIHHFVQTFLKEATKSKPKSRRSSRTGVGLEKEKSSVKPEILAIDFNNEGPEADHSKEILELKRTYSLLMKKFVNPRLDLMTDTRKNNKANMFDFKEKREIVQSLLNKIFYEGNEHKQLELSPRETYIEEKPSVGWSGQRTTKLAATPMVETTSKNVSSVMSSLPENKRLSPKNSTREKEKLRNHRLSSENSEDQRNKVQQRFARRHRAFESNFRTAKPLGELDREDTSVNRKSLSSRKKTNNILEYEEKEKKMSLRNKEISVTSKDISKDNAQPLFDMEFNNSSVINTEPTNLLNSVQNNEDPKTINKIKSEKNTICSVDQSGLDAVASKKDCLLSKNNTETDQTMYIPLTSELKPSDTAQDDLNLISDNNKIVNSSETTFDKHIEKVEHNKLTSSMKDQMRNETSTVMEGRASESNIETEQIKKGQSRSNKIDQEEINPKQSIVEPENEVKAQEISYWNLLSNKLLKTSCNAQKFINSLEISNWKTKTVDMTHSLANHIIERKTSDTQNPGNLTVETSKDNVKNNSNVADAKVNTLVLDKNVTLNEQTQILPDFRELHTKSVEKRCGKGRNVKASTTGPQVKQKHTETEGIHDGMYRNVKASASGPQVKQKHAEPVRFHDGIDRNVKASASGPLVKQKHAEPVRFHDGMDRNVKASALGPQVKQKHAEPVRFRDGIDRNVKASASGPQVNQKHRQEYRNKEHKLNSEVSVVNDLKVNKGDIDLTNNVNKLNKSSNNSNSEKKVITNVIPTTCTIGNGNIIGNKDKNINITDSKFADILKPKTPACNRPESHESPETKVTGETGVNPNNITNLDAGGDGNIKKILRKFRKVHKNKTKQNILPVYKIHGKFLNESKLKKQSSHNLRMNKETPYIHKGRKATRAKSSLSLGNKKYLTADTNYLVVPSLTVPHTNTVQEKSSKSVGKKLKGAISKVLHEMPARSIKVNRVNSNIFPQVNKDKIEHKETSTNDQSNTSKIESHTGNKKSENKKLNHNKTKIAIGLDLTKARKLHSRKELCKSVNKLKMYGTRNIYTLSHFEVKTPQNLLKTCYGDITKPSSQSLMNVSGLTFDKQINFYPLKIQSRSMHMFGTYDKKRESPRKKRTTVANSKIETTDSIGFNSNNETMFNLSNVKSSVKGKNSTLKLNKNKPKLKRLSKLSSGKLLIGNLRKKGSLKKDEESKLETKYKVQDNENKCTVNTDSKSGSSSPKCIQNIKTYESLVLFNKSDGMCLTPLSPTTESKRININSGVSKTDGVNIASCEPEHIKSSPENKEHDSMKWKSKEARLEKWKLELEETSFNKNVKDVNNKLNEVTEMDFYDTKTGGSHTHMIKEVLSNDGSTKETIVNNTAKSKIQSDSCVMNDNVEKNNLQKDTKIKSVKSCFENHEMNEKQMNDKVCNNNGKENSLMEDIKTETMNSSLNLQTKKDQQKSIKVLSGKFEKKLSQDVKSAAICNNFSKTQSKNEKKINFNIFNENLNEIDLQKDAKTKIKSRNMEKVDQLTNNFKVFKDYMKRNNMLKEVKTKAMSPIMKKQTKNEQQQNINDSNDKVGKNNLEKYVKSKSINKSIEKQITKIERKDNTNLNGNDGNNLLHKHSIPKEISRKVEKKVMSEQKDKNSLNYIMEKNNFKADVKGNSINNIAKEAEPENKKNCEDLLHVLPLNINKNISPRNKNESLPTKNQQPTTYKTGEYMKKDVSIDKIRDFELKLKVLESKLKNLELKTCNENNSALSSKAKNVISRADSVTPPHKSTNVAVNENNPELENGIKHSKLVHSEKQSSIYNKPKTTEAVENEKNSKKDHNDILKQHLSQKVKTLEVKLKNLETKVKDLKDTPISTTNKNENKMNSLSRSIENQNKPPNKDKPFPNVSKCSETSNNSKFNNQSMSLNISDKKIREPDFGKQCNTSTSLVSKSKVVTKNIIGNLNSSDEKTESANNIRHRENNNEILTQTANILSEIKLENKEGSTIKTSSLNKLKQKPLTKQVKSSKTTEYNKPKTIVRNIFNKLDTKTSQNTEGKAIKSPIKTVIYGNKSRRRNKVDNKALKYANQDSLRKKYNRSAQNKKMVGVIAQQGNSSPSPAIDSKQLNSSETTLKSKVFPKNISCTSGTSNVHRNVVKKATKKTKKSLPREASEKDLQKDSEQPPKKKTDAFNVAHTVKKKITPMIQNGSLHEGLLKSTRWLNPVGKNDSLTNAIDKISSSFQTKVPNSRENSKTPVLPKNLLDVLEQMKSPKQKQNLNHTEILDTVKTKNKKLAKKEVKYKVYNTFDYLKPKRRAHEVKHPIENEVKIIRKTENILDKLYPKYASLNQSLRNSKASTDLPEYLYKSLHILTSKKKQPIPKFRND